ncbi:nitroreductase family protein [Hymenobacter lapidiphilus]|uniref:Nitroreductase family protein n=1 Tax=Hymenobacter lapidiphilus TaxID=2608003 RepID=A0A7Y7PP09_9BACT|nr:nitroreductase family protein [Hymenobacter lapidiphilus]NVO31360.1 nitroreductase family protein [Hymenobacter lapidiphilus]
MSNQTAASRLAATSAPVLDVIRQRWSPRAFANRPVPEQAVQQLFEAAAWAPSAMNEQPWRYIYAHRADETAFRQLFDCLVPGNQAWARQAPVLMLALTKTAFSNGQANAAALHDLGMANSHLILEATALGLHGHFMGGFEADKARAAFGLPDDLQPVVMLALGYLGQAEQLEEPFLSREQAPRQRRPVTAFAFQGQLPN